jgi:hypothetical protein
MYDVVILTVYNGTQKQNDVPEGGVTDVSMPSTDMPYTSEVMFLIKIIHHSSFSPLPSTFTCVLYI